MEGIPLNLMVSRAAEKLDLTLVLPLSPNFAVGLLRPLVYVSKRLFYFYFFACMHIKTTEMRSVFLSCLESSHKHTSQVLCLPGPLPWPLLSPQAEG